MLRSKQFLILPQYYSSALGTITSYYHHRLLRFKNMNSESHNHSTSKSADAKVNKFQQVFHSSNTTNIGWDKCWEEGLTPWDLGSPTPVLLHLHNTGSLPTGRALVPGCGTGHDVEAIACPERHVVGLDISDSAVKKAAQLFSRSPKAEHFTFLKTDFFTWSPAELFDLIFDYTFFCAIEPNLRSLWAQKVCDLLKPDGELITLIYPIDDHEGGPPYKVSVQDYEEFLHPIGFKAMHIVDNDLAIPPRKFIAGTREIGEMETNYLPIVALRPRPSRNGTPKRN